jgi:betaine-aldehyde dehydrogenase
VHAHGTRHGKRVQALGGAKNHLVVMPDADLDQAADALVGAGYGSAGERCMAISVAVAVGGIGDALVDKIAARIRKLEVNDGTAPRAEMGPLVTAAHRQRVLQYIDTGRSEGATLATGGTAPQGRGTYLQPAVFLDAKPEMTIVREEIFGPVVAVMPFRDEAEAITLANDSQYGLSGSLWTRDLGRALRVARAFQTGNLSINSGSSVHLEAPFGGVKKSGLGRELGLAALDHYTEWKTIYMDVT